MIRAQEEKSPFHTLFMLQIVLIQSAKTGKKKPTAKQICTRMMHTKIDLDNHNSIMHK